MIPMETLEDDTRICKIELFPGLDLMLERVVLIEFIVRSDADSGRCKIRPSLPCVYMLFRVSFLGFGCTLLPFALFFVSLSYFLFDQHHLI